jgi:DNA-binding XRE family transcriptional regulator
MSTLEKIQGAAPDLSHEALTMALAILVERIRVLPSDDRRDLYELTKEFARAQCQEDVQCVVDAMREILEQAPIRVRKMDLSAEEAGPGLKKWIDIISEKIRTLRAAAGLTQGQLAEKSGLPQSHISRLENGQHSPSRATMEKIAKALDLPVSEFDPSA